MWAMATQMPTHLLPHAHSAPPPATPPRPQVQRVIGEAEVARLTAELEAEEAAAKGLKPGAKAAGAGGAQGSGADAGKAQEEDEDAGFFDEVEDEEPEEEQGRYTEISSLDVFGAPGPFDDLFGDVSPRPAGASKGKGRGKGRAQGRKPAGAR